MEGTWRDAHEWVRGQCTPFAHQQKPDTWAAWPPAPLPRFLAAISALYFGLLHHNSSALGCTQSLPHLPPSSPTSDRLISHPHSSSPPTASLFFFVFLSLCAFSRRLQSLNLVSAGVIHQTPHLINRNGSPNLPARPRRSIAPPPTSTLPLAGCPRLRSSAIHHLRRNLYFDSNSVSKNDSPRTRITAWTLPDLSSAVNRSSLRVRHPTSPNETTASTTEQRAKKPARFAADQNSDQPTLYLLAGNSFSTTSPPTPTSPLPGAPS